MKERKILKAGKSKMTLREKGLMLEKNLTVLVERNGRKRLQR